ncbi:unnamed protein product [Diamesa serratosioi]
MDTRKKLFKSRQEVATITKRIQANRLIAGNKRNNQFSMNRNLEFSPASPTVQRTQKISEISNKKEKLIAWRTEKNRVKFKEIIQKRSPFQTVVPVGRFISPKVRNVSKISTMSFLDKTPIRNMLMNQKVLKKSTIKEAIKTATTIKKVATSANIVSETTVISRKKILADISVIPSNDNIEDKSNIQNYDSSDKLMPMEEHFEDSTFKIHISGTENIPQEKNENIKPATKLRKSKSFLEFTNVVVTSPNVSLNIEKVSSEPRKMVSKPTLATKAVLKKPIIKEPLKVNNSNKPEPALRSAKVAVKKTVSKAVIKKVDKINDPTNNVELTTTQQSVKVLVNKVPEVKAKKVQKSRTYQLYKTSLENQRKYIAASLDKFSSNDDEFFEDLKEDNLTIVNQTLNQGKKFLNDKFKVFEDFLEKFEAERLNVEDPKRITDDDLANYWSLLYDEIRKHKAAMLEILEIKNRTIREKGENNKLSVKKRQSRLNFENVNSTPRRSMRVAVSKDTPKHSALCLACTPASTSNTPKSRRKRSVKKSVIFLENQNDSLPGTPKRRNSSKRYKATPKISLAKITTDLDDDDDVFG